MSNVRGRLTLCPTLLFSKKYTGQDAELADNERLFLKALVEDASTLSYN